ncbi:unnamed protein product [Tenebrio molitor]|nr:unnamed protein product [Tenebrio molitor]
MDGPSGNKYTIRSLINIKSAASPPLNYLGFCYLPVESGGWPQELDIGATFHLLGRWCNAVDH